MGSSIGDQALFVIHGDRGSALNLDIQALPTDCQARNLSRNTVRIYRNNLGMFRRWCQGKDVSDIRPHDVRVYLVTLERQGHNPGGRHQAYRTLKAFFRWLVREGDLDKSPMANLKAPKVPERTLEPLNLNHLKAMLRTCQRRTFCGDRDRAIVLALLDTGCRASEFIALNIEDVNLTSGAVIVKQGKGGKRRVTFLGNRCRRELLRYLRHRPDTDGSEPLWVTVNGSRLNYWGLRQVVRRRAERAGVPAPSLHSFRRAFAILSLRSGADLVSLQPVATSTNWRVRTYSPEVVGPQWCTESSSKWPAIHSFQGMTFMGMSRVTRLANRGGLRRR